MFRRTPEERERIPPGQHLTRGWPVLHAEMIPRFDAATWRFKTWGECENPFQMTWEEFTALPRITETNDIHCVTGWTKFDNSWEGVPFKDVAARAKMKPNATHALVHAPSGYTANLPIEALMDDDVVFAFTHNGEPIEPQHGGPMRLVVPKRYFWKSVKWANGVQFLDHDERGFWEERGYHNDAHPWTEERYSWQER